MIWNGYDYAKADDQYRRHHARFVRFVETKKLMCMECRGAGGWTDVILEDGSGPWEPCGWCEGTGYMTPNARGWWLTYKRQERMEQK